MPLPIRLTRLALIAGGVFGVLIILLSSGGCGGQDADAAPQYTKQGTFNVSIVNRTGHRLKDVYAHRLTPPMSFGRVAPGAIERKQAARQAMPRKIEIEWVNDETGETQWAIAHIHKQLGSDYHGHVTITLYGHNDWQLKKGI